MLACKPILSRILSEVVDECHGMTFEEIEACIEGEIQIERIPVETGYSNIVGSAQENYINLEGLIRYDIRTYLRIPNCEPELAKILIDVEAQKDENPGYDIPIRGLFYCSRMVSSQLTTEFSVRSDDKKQYGNIKKVYSIWICTETSQKRANTIEKYSINKKMLYGCDCDNERYDILSTVVINLSKTHNSNGVDNELICLLTDLFNDDMPANIKLSKLQKDYHISITQEIEKEVKEMCTYTSSVKEEGRVEGRVEGRIEGRENEIFTSVQEGDYGIARGAEKLNISNEEFIIRMEKAGFKVPVNA